MSWPTNPSSRMQRSVHYGARKLGELAKIVTGKLDANRAVQDGTYPFYTCADEVSRINETAFDGESILVAGNGDFWVKYHPSGKFNAYQRTYVIQNLSKETTTRYLYFVVSTQTPKFKKMAQGGIIKFLHLGQLQNLKIPLPPLATQKQIVERLDKITEAQKLNDNLIKKSDELFQSLLHQELNPTGRDWPTKKLGEVIEISYGKGLSRDSRVDYGKYFAYGSNGPVYKTDESLTKDETIVVGRKGTAGALYFVSEPCWPIDTTFFAKPKNDVSLKFIYYLLQTKGLPRLAIVTGVPGINRTTLANVNVQLPPITAQKQIVAKLSAVQDYKTQLLAQKSKLKELFDSALAESMNQTMKTNTY